MLIRTAPTVSHLLLTIGLTPSSGAGGATVVPMASETGVRCFKTSGPPTQIPFRIVEEIKLFVVVLISTVWSRERGWLFMPHKDTFIQC